MYGLIDYGAFRLASNQTKSLQIVSNQAFDINFVSNVFGVN